MRNAIEPSVLYIHVIFLTIAKINSRNKGRK